MSNLKKNTNYFKICLLKSKIRPNTLIPTNNTLLSYANLSSFLTKMSIFLRPIWKRMRLVLRIGHHNTYKNSTNFQKRSASRNNMKTSLACQHTFTVKPLRVKVSLTMWMRKIIWKLSILWTQILRSSDLNLCCLFLWEIGIRWKIGC